MHVELRTFMMEQTIPGVIAFSVLKSDLHICFVCSRNSYYLLLLALVEQLAL